MSAVDTIVLIILCIFLPPLAVYFKRRHCDRHICINLVLTLLCWLPGRCRGKLHHHSGHGRMVKFPHGMPNPPHHTRF